jgi:hypothetical protein
MQPKPHPPHRQRGVEHLVAKRALCIEATMSRTEELRKKLRDSVIQREGPLWGDKVWDAFNSAVDAFLTSERSASALSNDFTKKLYETYKADAPADMAQWIREKLDAKFLSQRNKPVWPYEPSWCYFEGEPPTFVHQFEDADGITFFVFQFIKKLAEPHEGLVSYYKMLAQTSEGTIHVAGDVTTNPYDPRMGAS